MTVVAEILDVNRVLRHGAELAELLAAASINDCQRVRQQSLTFLASIALGGGAAEAASKASDEAAATFIEQGFEGFVPQALFLKAEVATARGEDRTAFELYAEVAERLVPLQDAAGILHCLRVVGPILAERGRAEEAVKLLACNEHHTATIGFAVPDARQPAIEQALSDLRHTVGDRFEQLWAEGAALELNEAAVLCANTAKDEAAGVDTQSSATT